MAGANGQVRPRDRCAAVTDYILWPLCPGLCAVWAVRAVPAGLVASPRLRSSCRSGAKATGGLAEEFKELTHWDRMSYLREEEKKTPTPS